VHNTAGKLLRECPPRHHYNGKLTTYYPQCYNRRTGNSETTKCSQFYLKYDGTSGLRSCTRPNKPIKSINGINKTLKPRKNVASISDCIYYSQPAESRDTCNSDSFSDSSANGNVNRSDQTDDEKKRINKTIYEEPYTLPTKSLTQGDDRRYHRNYRKLIRDYTPKYHINGTSSTYYFPPYNKRSNPPTGLGNKPWHKLLRKISSKTGNPSKYMAKASTKASRYESLKRIYQKYNHLSFMK